MKLKKLEDDMFSGSIVVSNARLFFFAAPIAQSTVRKVLCSLSFP